MRLCRTVDGVFTVIYRWRIKAGREAEFERVWRRRTEKIHATRGSFGARLHREPDGTYASIALWPSRQAWERDGPPLPDDAEDEKIFRESLCDVFSPLLLEVVDDYWKRP